MGRFPQVLLPCKSSKISRISGPSAVQFRKYDKKLSNRLWYSTVSSKIVTEGKFDQGKTNVALKFNKEDGILKYYNDFGDFSCFVQAQPLVYLDVALITNKGVVINHETHIGKGKKKEGSVFQTNPIIVQTDENGNCSFRCHVYTSCQNCKCLFFIVKVSYRFEDQLYTYVSSPFVGATKDPFQTLVGGPAMSFLSSMSYDEFIKSHQLTTLIVYKNPDEAEAMSHINRSDSPPPAPAPSRGKKSSATSNSTVVDTEPVNFVIHQLNGEEVLSYYKDVNSTSSLEELLSDSKPNATYKLSKARSLSHQSADSIEINKETNYNYLEKRAKIFVNQLVNWEKRGQIHAMERDQILRDAVRQFDYYLKQELSSQLAQITQHQAGIINAAALQNRDSALLMQAKLNTAYGAYGSPYTTSVSAAAAAAASLNNRGSTDPVNHLAFPYSGYTTTTTTAATSSSLEDNRAITTSAAAAAAMALNAGGRSIKRSPQQSPFEEANFAPLHNYSSHFGGSYIDQETVAAMASNMEGAHGVSPEDFKDILSETSTTASKQQTPGSGGGAGGVSNIRFRDTEEELLNQQLRRDSGPGHSYNSMTEFKTAVAAATTAAASFYKPVFKLDAIQSTLEAFKSNKQAMFSSTTHASLAKSMAVRVKRDMEMQMMNNITYGFANGSSNSSGSSNGLGNGGLPINMSDYAEAHDSPNKKARTVEFESKFLPRDDNTNPSSRSLSLSAVLASHNTSSSSSASAAPASMSSRRSVSSASSSICINDLVSTPVLDSVCAFENGRSGVKGGVGVGQNCDDAAMVLMSLQKKK